MEIVIENNRYTPKIICERKDEYNIPIYQRLFAWDNENITQLLDNLRDQFLKSVDSPYYIGMLTMYGRERDLVDGQQRFTVLSLIGSVFKEYDPRWKSMHEKLHLNARPNDEEFLKSLFKAGSCADYINEKMAIGRNTICSWVDVNKKTINMNVFSKYVFEKCTFFLAGLPEDYRPRDLNKYFEAMNSTGRNLESHEIIKVTKYLKSMSSDQDKYNTIWNLVSDMDKPLIRKRTNEGSKEDEEAFRNRYKTSIYNFDSHFLDELDLNDLKSSNENMLDEYKTIRELEANGHNPDVRRQDKYYGEGNHSMLTFQEFFLLILYVQLIADNRKKVNVNEFFDTHKLQDTVNDYTKEWHEEEWKKLGRELLRYRLVFDYYIIRIPNSEAGNYDLDYSETKDNEIDASIITQMQSYLYVDSSSKTYYRWVVPFLEFLGGKDNLTADQIFNKLREVDDEIDEHSKNFLNDESSYSYGSRRTVYLLRRLDFYLWLTNHLLKKTNDKSYPIINDFKYKRSINSQEHLHPQNDEDRSGYIPWDEEKHKFGNLFLISASLNSTQSDDTINTKFGRIKDQIEYSRIESIKLYLIYTICKNKEEEWTIFKMKSHQEKMISFLKKTFVKDFVAEIRKNYTDFKNDTDSTNFYIDFLEQVDLNNIIENCKN